MIFFYEKEVCFSLPLVPSIMFPALRASLEPVSLLGNSLKNMTGGCQELVVLFDSVELLWCSVGAEVLSAQQL